MDALWSQTPSGGAMRFQRFTPHIHICPLSVPPAIVAVTVCAESPSSVKVTRI